MSETKTAQTDLRRNLYRVRLKFVNRPDGNVFERTVRDRLVRHSNCDFLIKFANGSQEVRFANVGL